MPFSVQSQALDAVVALLGAVNAGAWKAYRSRMVPFNPAQLPAFNVIPDEAEPVYDGAYSGAVDWKFRFKVRCTVVGDDGVDKLADPLFVAASSAILTDPTLGGTVHTTRFLGVKWEREEEGLQAPCALVATFESEFATSRSDPSDLMP